MPDVSKTTWEEKMETPTCTRRKVAARRARNKCNRRSSENVIRRGQNHFLLQMPKYPTCKGSDVLSYGRRAPPPRPATQKATPHHRVASTLAWNNGTFLLISSSSASWAPLCKHNFKISNSMSLSLAAVCSSLKLSS